VERVRRATADDLDECAALLSRARDELAGKRGAEQLLSVARADVAEWWDAGPDRVLLVGEFEDATVGFAAGRVGERRVGTVDCCYVVPEARRVGVGGALMAHLMQWFGDAGCSEVDAVALPGDRETKQLYESAGFTARLLILHRRLR
jgi:GNAT superfamily N-acetyltransferase